MFGNLQAQPADPILGLLAKYKEDTSVQKIDLGVESNLKPMAKKYIQKDIIYA